MMGGTVVVLHWMSPYSFCSFLKIKKFKRLEKSGKFVKTKVPDFFLGIFLVNATAISMYNQKKFRVYHFYH